ncbi:MAG: pitrilysin family protein, partial [Pygmaiobacter sp.]
MHRTELAEGVMLTHIPADKFKTGRITINFILPATRKTATVAALLPLLLERSCAEWPDMTAFSKKLAQLYGAALSAENAVQGTRRVLSVSISGIKDRYALTGEALSAEYTRVLFEVAFRPHFVNGVFDPETLEIEKQKLREALENEINEKRTYCIRQAKRKFFGDSPNGVEKNGYLEEVDGITSEEVTAFYHEMIRTATIELMVIGADAAAVGASFTERFCTQNRAPQAPPALFAMPRTEELVTEEPLDTVQGKLCMLYTTGELLTEEDFLKMRLAAAILGALPTSRLFMNVREKQSLCYYCAAGYSSLTGMFMVDSGVEHCNAQRTKAAIQQELQTLCTELVGEEELADAKRALTSALAGVEDSLYGIENWYFGNIMRGITEAPCETAQRIERVTAEDVRSALQRLSLSVTYCLTKGD